MKLPLEFKKHLVSWCTMHGIDERQAKEWFHGCKTSDDFVTALLQLHRGLTKKEATSLISRLLVGIELARDR